METLEEGTPDPVDVHVGQKIRARRVKLGYSQTQLGEAIGVTFQQIQKYERGTNRIAASRLYYAARFLQTPLSSFFNGLEPTGPKKPSSIREVFEKLATDPVGTKVDFPFGSLSSPNAAKNMAAKVGRRSGWVKITPTTKGVTVEKIEQP